ncbi:MAG: SOUL family heme-binding protein, partial [Candidatus Nanopelagicales bacterium]
MTEQQKYTLVKKLENLEIRKYQKCTMATVEINADYEAAGSIGFRPLVTYISQNNIAMTAPVLQQKTKSDTWLVSFVMPEGMQLSDLPVSPNLNIKLHEVEEYVAAVLTFKGITSKQKIREKESELKELVNKYKLNSFGEILVARFDPPWKPGFLRHNEV